MSDYTWGSLLNDCDDSCGIALYDIAGDVLGVVLSSTPRADSYIAVADTVDEWLSTSVTTCELAVCYVEEAFGLLGKCGREEVAWVL